MLISAESGMNDMSLEAPVGARDDMEVDVAVEEEPRDGEREDRDEGGEGAREDEPEGGGAADEVREGGPGAGVAVHGDGRGAGEGLPLGDTEPLDVAVPGTGGGHRRGGGHGGRGGRGGRGSGGVGGGIGGGGLILPWQVLVACGFSECLPIWCVFWCEKWQGVL